MAYVAAMYAAVFHYRLVFLRLVSRGQLPYLLSPIPNPQSRKMPRSILASLKLKPQTLNPEAHVLESVSEAFERESFSALPRNGRPLNISWQNLKKRVDLCESSEMC